MKNDIAEKIQKLLSLANSCNENEAKLAAQKAQELLVKYNLSMQEVTAVNYDYEKKDFTEINRVERHILNIGQILQTYFFVKIVIHRGKSRFDKSRLFIYGKPLNIETAGYVYSFLVQAYPELWKKHKKENKDAHRISYYRGLTAGLTEALKVARFKVEQETGLVIIADKELEKMVKGRSTIRSAATRHEENSFNSGLQDGKNIKIRKALTSDSSQSGKYLK